MARALKEWVESDVSEFRDKPLNWLSQYHFFRDPTRPVYSDTRYFFSPADGVVLYGRTVDAGEPLVDIKGKPYSVREALRDPHYHHRSLVIGIFMTFFDVHVNRIPYPGRLSYRLLDPIDTLNHPMLDVEKGILEDLRLSMHHAGYLHHNQRVVNRVDSSRLGHSYYVLQVADYDVDSITPFTLRQNHPCYQGQRFSQIRYGSQVDLIIPTCRCHDFLPLVAPETHVEAGVDPLVEVKATAKHHPDTQQEN
jgi:phosphatidylserine decarboxylase